MTDFDELVQSDIAAAQETLRRLDGAPASAVARVSALLVKSLGAGGQALICGNGGSAADAQHFAAELTGRFMYDRPGLPAHALTTNSSLMTAISNDYGYDAAFARQVNAMARPGDVVIGISTSGRSPNVLAALKAARERGALTVGLCGAHTAELAPLCDELIAIPQSATPRVQEAHILCIHIISHIVERSLFPQDAAAKD